ncbi:MAG: SPFH domain-containing protein [Caldilineaceae bacterium]|nr:SPFH domain-containing protein [Caldilineaceae bacterium]
MNRVRNIVGTVADVAQSEEFAQFRINARDFLSAREAGTSTSTQIEQVVTSLGEVAEMLNRSYPQAEQDGAASVTNIISPVVIPRRGGSLVLRLLIAGALLGLGLFGWLITATLGRIPGLGHLPAVFFGPHYWLLVLGYLGFTLWKHSYVMVPDGSQALITRFGKLEATVGPGRTWLWNPWKRVSYIVNTAKEYPYNAPIRQAPTASRVSASVDLFLQFRIENPAEFIFTLGGVKGFSEKLQNAVSEVTRALIYEQRAETIYDLVGENTQELLTTLNNQFLPAVRFVNANITHAEPADQEYRMDLAAAEIIRVAKEAYTYQYELNLRKEQDEGELNKELASLRETLSEIRAEIAKYQAQIDTAREKEVNRANAYAHRLRIEAESEAKANAALLEAQALDVRAAGSAFFPEILEFRFQEDILDKLESIATQLPQIVHLGPHDADAVDFMSIARQMLGVSTDALYSDEDMQAIRGRLDSILTRIDERTRQIGGMVEAEKEVAALTQREPGAESATAAALPKGGSL